eukprot:TRINITY_DN5828_c0_g1_i1.p2 TRINITY_DN5828_c0_g1~~TRINITY_DN5828_c0_g1_i1.p2  ORF type:complete len:340 (+),score=41.09 TRINITY_DN5828_c0_g1_i1:217-1236(+)
MKRSTMQEAEVDLESIWFASGLAGGVGERPQFVKLGHGAHNMNYLVVFSTEKKMVIRMFLSKQMKDSCQKEAVALRFLDGADAPRIFASSFGTADQKPKVQVNYIIEEYIQGCTLAQEFGGSEPSDSVLIECANVLIGLHSKDISSLKSNILDDVKEAAVVLPAAAHDVISTSFAARVFPHVQRLLQDCERATESLQKQILQHPEDYLGPIVLCHGDVCFDNFYRRTSDSKLIQLDWEFAHLGYGMEDLASLVNENKLTSSQEEILLLNYFRTRPMTPQQREAFWAWKIRRSFGLFTIVIDRLRLMEEGVSSELDNKQIYTDVINAEVDYVRTLLSNRP